MDIQTYLVLENVRSAGWFQPELWLTFGTLALFLLDVGWRRSPERARNMMLATLAVLGVAAVLLAVEPTTPQSLFNGLIVHDAFATFFKWLFLAGAVLTVFIAAPSAAFPAALVGQFYALLCSVVLGLFLMASASDLLMIFMSIELVSMVSYVLAGFTRGNRKASEAALKYVIFGGVASGVMVFGMSYLYGLLQTTNILEFAPRLAALPPTWPVKLTLVLAVVFLSAGIGYKIAAVPWHMWCPDVYEGAPTPFTAFLSVGPKAAGFALTARLLYGALSTRPNLSGFSEALHGIPWPAVVGLLSAVTMTLGNLTALPQTNLKRLLAYSSIAHAGYALMGVAANSLIGTQAVMVYMLAYLVMNLGAFLAVIVIERLTGSPSIFEFRGLGRRAPLAAVSFGVFLFALTGLPPSIGFTGKYYLFLAVMERVNGPAGFWYAVLALVAALNTAVSLYYYARILRAMFLEAPFAEAEVTYPFSYKVLLSGFAFATVLFGIWLTPMIEWTKASLVLFRGG
ncbi:MAG TPA: NADH-quinone oxidoreductase subunit N [Anaeromyxobacteraceae bacterium]|nr:NADH-quinone oxidoreductase subunit N [Anaeromyxobacteraceae bacterium]